MQLQVMSGSETVEETGRADEFPGYPIALVSAASLFIVSGIASLSGALDLALSYAAAAAAITAASSVSDRRARVAIIRKRL